MGQSPSLVRSRALGVHVEATDGKYPTGLSTSSKTSATVRIRRRVTRRRACQEEVHVFWAVGANIVDADDLAVGIDRSEFGDATVIVTVLR